VGGTIGEIISTLPEFVVIVFIVSIEPVTSLLIAIVTIYNNAIFFRFTRFSFPKQQAMANTRFPPPCIKQGVKFSL
jgi:hypothetical protein